MIEAISFKRYDDAKKVRVCLPYMFLFLLIVDFSSDSF